MNQRMSPTMQGPHTSLKMHQFGPQRGSFVDRRETSLANMYLHGNRIHSRKHLVF